MVLKHFQRDDALGALNTVNKSVEKTDKKNLWKEALWKALFACLLFFLFDHFQAINLVRENVENPAFDMVYKPALSHFDQTAKSENKKVSVFAFDNAFMRKEGLYIKDEFAKKESLDNVNYAYVFPRKYIVKFILDLDERIKEEGVSCPKALFIDFDLSFPVATVNEENNNDKNNKTLLEVLKNKDRCYTILIPKIGIKHYIEESDDEQIKHLINHKKIIFVSPYFHINEDAQVRRYQPTKKIADKEYPSAAHALWKIMNDQAIDTQQIKKDFPDYVDASQAYSNNKRPSVNGTIIWFKTYIAEPGSIETSKNCMTCYSHWKNLIKYSLADSLENQFSDAFDNSVILLGGTYQPNPDYYDSGDYYSVLNFLGSESFSGIDIHANILMTLLHFDQNKPMQNVGLLPSLLIIFISFFLVDLMVSSFFQRIGRSNEKIELFLTLIINIVLLYFISWFFLIRAEPPLWFNWIIPLILIELVEIIIFVRKYLGLRIK